MVIWFSVIGVLGARSVMLNPSILMALNPIHAVDFVMSSNIPTLLLTLGSVMLVITGGEAMYADMGHFGKKPIQLGWYLVAYPMLVANYLGQGAYLISGKPVLYENVFYSMVPQQALIPMVILSTFATIIASQALISGAFSLTMQAISLRLLPYMHIKHTHEAHEGQVYMPDINWALYIGAVLLVIVFGSSSGLAGAYGLAVSGVMFVTTLGIMTVARSLWKWHRWQVYLLFIPFACLDLLFLVANSMKLFEGGWIPLTIGLGIYALITTWQWGRTHTINTFNRVKTMTVKELVKLQLSTPNDLPRTMVFLTRKPIHTLDDGIPIQLERYWDRNASLPEHLVLLNVELLKTPHAEKRTEVIHFTPKESKSGSVTSLTVRFGFMEDPDLEPLVRRFIKDKEIPSQHPPEQWVFKVVHERVSLNSAATWWTKFTFQIYRFLQRNTQSADEYFGLGDDHMLTIDVYPVELS
jgi:KUP system potassium uptake protein